MVSKEARQLLKWLSARSTDWFYPNEIRQGLKKDTSYMLLQTLLNEKYINCLDSPDSQPVENDYGEPALMFQISDYGTAYLEDHSATKWKELRAWVSLLIALAAFVKSFFF